MPGKLWPTLFGEKKVIQYIWRSSWLEPKPAVATGTLLIAVVILLAVVVSIFSYQSQNAKIAVPNTNTASSEAVTIREIQEQEQNVSLKSSLSPAPQTSLVPVKNEIEPSLPSTPKETQAEKNELRKNLLTKSPAVEFGWQYSATYQDWRFYPGVDLLAPEAKIPALEAGKVETVLTDSNFGLTVVVLAGQYKIHYAFLKSTPLEKGDTLFAGDTIGFVEATEGNRLHLRVESLATGKYLNPMEVLI